MGTKILRGAHKSYLLVSKIPLVPHRTETGTSIDVDVKKIEIRSPSALHPGRQKLADNYGLTEPLLSPTMPPLEDAETRFEYHEIGAMGVPLPIEIRA